MPCYTLKTVAVDQENFAVKIISRSRSTAKIKHAKNKITWRWSLNKLAHKSTLHEVNVRSTTTAEVTWPTSNAIPIITYFSSLSLCMMRWLSVGSHDPQQRSHDPPVIQPLSSLTLVLSLAAWWGHCPWEFCLSVACSCASESLHASFPVERGEGRQRREEKWGEEGRVREGGKEEEDDLYSSC